MSADSKNIRNKNNLEYLHKHCKEENNGTFYNNFHLPTQPS